MGDEAPRHVGMVWIPPGKLISGALWTQVPRVADAELPGDAFELTGFHVDLYLHPNEAGALPTTSVSRDEAERLCGESGKRLCTELELERACKGPDNWIYPYGNEYQAERCETGKAGDSLTPNGFHGLCTSAFGVADVHGSVWSWTSSDYGRGTEGLVTLKGGNGSHGELVGRCAHVASRKPQEKANHVGFRCCLGPRNSAEVKLVVERGAPLRYRPDDAAHRLLFEQAIHRLEAAGEGTTSDPNATNEGPVPKLFVVERIWLWHPLGNEELWLAGGCAPDPRAKRCGIFIGRIEAGVLTLLRFVSSGRWQPTLSESAEARGVHIYGGDDVGAFRKLVSWDWGRVAIAERERTKNHERWSKE
jgi:hypothetical protein